MEKGHSFKKVPLPIFSILPFHLFAPSSRVSGAVVPEPFLKILQCNFDWSLDSSLHLTALDQLSLIYLPAFQLPKFSYCCGLSCFLFLEGLNLLEQSVCLVQRDFSSKQNYCRCSRICVFRFEPYKITIFVGQKLVGNWQLHVVQPHMCFFFYITLKISFHEIGEMAYLFLSDDPHESIRAP